MMTLLHNFIGIMLAAEIVVPSFSHKTVTTDAGTTQGDRAILSDEGVLHKTGSAKLTLPTAKLLASDRRIAVDAGTLELGFGDAAGTAPEVPTLPDSLVAKALLWVSSRDAERIVTTASGVSAWYDHRETDNASPSYVYAAADMTYSSGALPTVGNIGTDGAVTNAIYFGGCQSGQAMRWKTPSGANYADAGVYVGVQQTFAVHSISNTQGQIFTQSGVENGDFRCSWVADTDNDPASTMNNYICWSAGPYAPMVNGRFYINGVRTDGTLTKPTTGLQLYEYIPLRQTSWNVDSFYSYNSTKRSGGDYLCEVMVFTNKLSETERMLVTDYLMRKWGLGHSVVTTAADIAADARLAVGEASGDQARMSLSGCGTVEKTGEGAFVYKSYASPRFDGAVEVQDGSVVLQADAAVKVAAGKRLTATMPAAGKTVVVSDLTESDTFIKDGDGSVRISGVPSGLRVLKVEAGTLDIATAKKVSDVSRTAYEIEIPDSSFENAAAMIADCGQGSPVCYIQITNETAVMQSFNVGWHRCATGCQVWAIDWPAWTGNGPGAVSRIAYHQYAPPPDGHCYFAIKCSATAHGAIMSKAITLTEAGTYEITFDLGRRYTAKYSGVAVQAGLTTKSNASTLDNANGLVFGTVAHDSTTGFKTCKVRRANIPAGTYYLVFESLKGSEIGRSGTDIGLITLDDIHLAKVPDDPHADDAWKIPGGDFENLLNGANALKYTADNTHPNWTFTQTNGWVAGTLPCAGLVSLGANSGNEIGGTLGAGVLFNDSRAPDANGWELGLFAKDTAAETTFTPTAGTWQVDGFVARLGSYGRSPSITAYVKIGDGAYQKMRTIAPSTRLMERVALTDSFTVDGETAVSLKLVMGANDWGKIDTGVSGVLVDDLVLAKSTDLELFDYDKDNLNTTTSRKLHGFSDAGGSTAGRRPITEAPTILGAEAVDGTTYFLAIRGQAGVYEDVHLPFAGRYSLSFYDHSRLSHVDKTGSWGYNDLKAWVVDLYGVTNVLGYADNRSSDWTQETFEFEISTPGVYRFGIQGTQTVGSNREAMLDAISLRQVAAASRTAPFASNARIRVNEGSRLGLDFTGTNTIQALRLGARSLRGIVNVADYPEYLTGTGAFRIVPAGTVISVK